MKKLMIALAMLLGLASCHKWDGKTLYMEDYYDGIIHIDPNCKNIVWRHDGYKTHLIRVPLADVKEYLLCPVCIDDGTEKEIMAAKRSKMRIVKSSNDSSSLWSDTTYVGEYDDF